MSASLFSTMLDPAAAAATMPASEPTRPFYSLPGPEFATPGDATRLIYTLMQLVHPHCCVAQFCGAHEGEGTSTLLRDTALIAAGIGLRVAILDLGFPGQAQAAALRSLIDCRLWQPTTGALPLTGEMQFLQCGQSGLCVSEMISRWVPSQLRVAELFSGVKRHFDLVLVDTPPLEQSADLLAYAQHATTSVIVMSAESTRVKVIEDLRNRLAEAGGHIAGIALNRRRFHIPRGLYTRL